MHQKKSRDQSSGRLQPSSSSLLGRLPLPLQPGQHALHAALDLGEPRALGWIPGQDPLYEIHEHGRTIQVGALQGGQLQLGTRAKGPPGRQ